MCAEPTNIPFIPAWLSYIAKICGYWPSNIKNNRSQQSIGNWIWSAISIFVYVTCIYILFTTFHVHFGLGFSPLELAIEVLISTCYAISSIVTVMIAIFNRNVLQELFNIARNFDKEVTHILTCENHIELYNDTIILHQIVQLQCLVYNRNVGKDWFVWLVAVPAFIINALAVLAWGIVLVKMTTNGADFTWAEMLNWLSFLILTQTQTVLAIFYSGILHCIFRRFKILNTTVSWNLDIRPIGCAEEAHIVAVIGRWATMHDDLINAVSAINQCYALPVRYDCSPTGDCVNNWNIL